MFVIFRLIDCDSACVCLWGFFYVMFVSIFNVCYCFVLLMLCVCVCVCDLRDGQVTWSSPASTTSHRPRRRSQTKSLRGTGCSKEFVPFCPQFSYTSCSISMSLLSRDNGTEEKRHLEKKDIYIYIYIYRERERETLTDVEKDKLTHIFVKNHV